MGRTTLITGGAGFAGSNLAILFKRDNPSDRVIALDNLKRRGSELNLLRLREAGVEFIHGDIRNREDLDGIGAFNIMIECSAEPSVLAGFHGSPDYLINTNLLGTVNCLEAVRRHGADIIFLSTSRVYPIKEINDLRYVELPTRFDLDPDQAVPGVSGEGISEEFPMGRTRSLYGATKLASELLIMEYGEMYSIRAVINRCGVLTGPWQMGKVDQGFMVLWVASHFYKRPLSYLGYGGKGKQVRDVLHINDLYRLLRIQIADIDTYTGHLFNVGGGRQTSVSLCELTRYCEHYTGNTIEIQQKLENRPADIPYYISDCTRIRNETGWTPIASVEDIVREIAEWIISHRDSLAPILS